MCGIVGYLGKRAAFPIVIDGLKTLRVSRIRQRWFYLKR